MPRRRAADAEPGMDMLPGIEDAFADRLDEEDEDGIRGAAAGRIGAMSDSSARPGDSPRVRVSSPKEGRSSRQRPMGAAARVRIAARLLALFFVLAAALYGFHTLEQFLIRDPRFALTGPAGAVENPSLEIRGATHVSRRSVEQIFEEDSGRSVYLIPLESRRTSLRAVDWVKDASVARVWPNHVLVQVTERKPVAFVPLSPTRFALIDDEGVILPSVPDRFHLPVLRGVRSSEPIGDRAQKVHRMMRLLQELGAMSGKISEVDASDPDNLKVKQPYESSMITLMLGDQNFGTRYKNFLNHYSEIKQKLPGATVLDLRIEDRITVVEP